MDEMVGTRTGPRRWERVSETGRALLERYPGIYVRAAQLRTPKRIAINHATDLLIEGFPRSGNSFLVSWVSRANPSLRIASHMHSVAHVRAALRRSIPAVVVIRPAEDAIASLAVYSPNQPMATHIERYRRFHHSLLPLVPDVLISPFAVTTQEPHRVVEALQPRVATPLATMPPGGIDEAMAAVDKRREEFGSGPDETKVARPSEVRRSAIEQVRHELRAHHHAELARLSDLHDTLLNSSSTLPVVPGG